MLILKESCTDVCIVAMNVVLNGGDPNYVAPLPLDFVAHS